MLTKNFQYSIPTHISFTLYRYNHIDSLIISTIRKECNTVEIKDNTFKLSISDFSTAINRNARLSREIEKYNNGSFKERSKFNSIYFICDFITKFNNLEWVSFSVSNDKSYSRLINYENQKVISFNYSVVAGILDLPSLLTQTQLERFNRFLIKCKIIKNSYLLRSSYFYIKLSSLFSLFEKFELTDDDDFIDIIFDNIDPKVDEDNPLLLIKLDYLIY